MPRARVRCPKSAWVAAAIATILGSALPLQAESDPAPQPSPPPAELPGDLTSLHILTAEISFDFGELGTDWRKELSTDDPTQTILLRWNYLGPGFTSAVLTVHDPNGVQLGSLPLTADGTPGLRQQSFLLSQFMANPTFTMRVRVIDGGGQQIGSASNEVQINEPQPADPFLYTPLFIGGLPDDYAVPGIAGGAWCADGFPQERRFFAGYRRFDVGRGPVGEDLGGPVGPDDLWHIGSDTKAMTCTIMALLIDSGVFTSTGAPVSWSTSIADIFPEWSNEIHPRFNSTTLTHLACHRSGLRMTGAEDAETRDQSPGAPNDNPRQFRRDMTRRLLARDHIEDIDGAPGIGQPTVPGTSFVYGRGNYLILGAVIEQLINSSYETAAQQWLFGPAGMTTAAFGMPTDVSHLQPSGHRRHVDYPHATYRDLRPCDPIWNAAGSAYMSIHDWLLFLRLHITGRAGTLSLSQAQRDILHAPFPGGDGVSYGYGWGIVDDMDGRFLTHDGTYGRFYATCKVHLGLQVAVCAATNLGPDEKRDAMGKVIWQDTFPAVATHLLSDHLFERAIDKAAIGGFPPGLFEFGPTGSPGILQVPEFVEFDTLLGPTLTPVFRPAEFLPVSLYQIETRNRALAAEARLPQVTDFLPLAGGRHQITFRSEAGVPYEIWRTNDLRNYSFDQEVVGPEGGDTASATVTNRNPHTEFYFVRDVLTTPPPGPGAAP